MTKHSGRIFQIIRDALLLFIALTATNLLAARSDFGWLELNPTPWLLPPLLLGARYGFMAGILSGLVSIIIIALGQAGFEHAAASALLREHPFFFTAIALTGTLAGEVRDQITRSSRHAQRDRDIYRSRYEQLQTRLHLALETRHDLERRLATFNAPVAALDDELRGLFDQPAERFDEELLALLHHTSDITSAAIYEINRQTLRRIAALHPTAPLAEELDLQTSALASQAIDQQRMVAVLEISQLSHDQPFIAAIPFTAGNAGRRVLLVQDLPFAAFNPQNIARLELSLSWVTAIAVMRRPMIANEPVLPREDFELLLGDATHAARLHALPSVLLRLTKADAAGLKKALALLPSTSISSRGTSADALDVLLPFAGRLEASTLSTELANAIPGLQTQIELITGAAS